MPGIFKGMFYFLKRMDGQQAAHFDQRMGKFEEEITGMLEEET